VTATTTHFGTPTTRPVTTTTRPGTTPTTSRVPLVGDINGDGKVGCQDFQFLSAEWGDTGTGLLADFNGDGVVDAQDFARFSFYFTGDGTSFSSPELGTCTPTDP